MSNTRIPIKVSDDGSLYQSEAKIYPREVGGRFQRLRNLAVFWLLGMYYVFPWISINGQQLVLFDLPARQFHVFGLTFWPQDFILLSALLIIAGLTLFFFTALAGRVWCGFACPQTVWTEAFLWMERITEGPRGKRIKLDQAPWNAEKIRRKTAKHFLWLVFALWTGFTFVGFFTPIRDLSTRVPFELGGWETFWILFYSLATWGNAGFLREQVCKYMCPYARFQSAMFDPDTLIISYDESRGEPRGGRRRSVPSHASRQALEAEGRLEDHPTPNELGDCIDCTLCVQVCPTGIDIRDGLQIECIACAACVDACDEVMDKMGYERGLIRYTTENALQGKPSRILRPRTAVYGLILAAIISTFVWAVFNRSELIVEVLRDRNVMYRETVDDRIENVYTIKLVNKASEERYYEISVTGEDAVSGLDLPDSVRVDAGQVRDLVVTLTAPADAVSGRHPITFQVRRIDDPDQVKSNDSAFFAPEQR